MKDDHDAIELRPSVENVSRLAAKQSAYLDFGYHLHREDQRTYQIDYVGDVHERAVLLERLGRVGANADEAAQGTSAHDPLHPGLIDPLQVDRVKNVVELLRQLERIVGDGVWRC